MVQRTTIELLDDLDGRQADETVSFALDGISYEIDLSKGNAAALRDCLAKFTAVARVVRAGPFSKMAAAYKPVRAAGGRKADLVALRAWAQSNGVPVGGRGRIAADVEARFWSATGR